MKKTMTSRQHGSRAQQRHPAATSSPTHSSETPRWFIAYLTEDREGRKVVHVLRLLWNQDDVSAAELWNRPDTLDVLEPYEAVNMAAAKEQAKDHFRESLGDPTQRDSDSFSGRDPGVILSPGVSSSRSGGSDNLSLWGAMALGLLLLVAFLLLVK